MKIAYEDRNFSKKSLGRIEQANTIIDEYEAQGFTLTLRQLYYQFVARNLLENTGRSYKRIGKLIRDARMAGHVSWTAIEDRGRSLVEWLKEEDERNVFRDLERRFALDYWSRQGVYVEVWIEKAALRNIIERPCSAYRVPHLGCIGYLSISEIWRAAHERFERAAAEGRRCVLIHLGDHDPSGLDMTRDNKDRLDRLTDIASVEIRRIALNIDQVVHYNPPPNPTKETDTRAAEYVQRFGNHSWELDALEPSVIEELIESELDSLIDFDVWAETKEEEDERRSVLARVHDRWDDIVEMLGGAA